MRKLPSPWRWPLSAAAALMLAYLLAQGAARFYPAGDLAPFRRPPGPSRPLVVLGEVDVVADASPSSASPAAQPPPATPSMSLRDLWLTYIADRSEAALRRPPTAPPPPRLAPRRDLAFLAAPDTSAAARLLWSAFLQNERRGSWLEAGRWRGYARKAADFGSRKKLIFNESWLEDADLR